MQRKEEKIMDILDALHLISAGLDWAAEMEDEETLKAIFDAEDVLYKYVYEKEGIKK